MAFNVLEIGYGSSFKSAPVSGGDIFERPDINYFGVDLPRDRAGVKPEHFGILKPVEAHWAALPYADNAFGAVAMRSCFGQFRDSSEVWVSELWSVDFGLLEVARVLEPGGQLFISEENTPQDLDRVIPDIIRAGFDIEALEREIDKSGDPNPAFATLRQQFYGDELRGISGGGVCNQRYVLSARKSEDRFYAVTSREVGRDILAHRTSYRGEWQAPDSKVELPYHVPEDKGTVEAELRVARKLVEVIGDRYDFWVKHLEAEQSQPT